MRSRRWDAFLSGVQTRHIGKGPSVLHSREVPRYEELVRYTCERLGWDAERFDVHRCRVEYPPLHWKVVVRLPYPEKPTT